MSIAVDCPACMLGEHDGHDALHGIIPGLIGGSRCDCEGDCAERAKAAWERMKDKWGIVGLGPSFKTEAEIIGVDGYDEFGIPTGDHRATCGCWFEGRDLKTVCDTHQKLFSDATLKFLSIGEDADEAKRPSHH